MKIIYKLLSLVALIAITGSCVNDTDYETPQISCEEISLSAPEWNQLTIEQVLAQWTDNTLKEFDADSNSYFVGYITSSDKTGNFYKELYLQDAIENPTFAIKLEINKRSLFTTYDVGRKIAVKLAGLVLDKSHGEMVLGENNNSHVGQMREKKATQNIIRSCDAYDIVPILVSSPSEITDEHLGKLVQFDNMQFEDNLLGKTFVDPLDSFDSQRNITNVTDGSSVILETSTFASFGDTTLPTLRGSVKGIIARDYGDDNYVLRINGVEDFTFDQDRFDPNYFFEEDFQTVETGVLNMSGWFNYAEAGGKKWVVKEYQGNTYVEFSAYQTGDSSNICWLITPAIDLDATTNEFFKFSTAQHHLDSGHDGLEVFISSDFNNTENGIQSATWTKLSPTLPDDSTSWYNFIGSGNLDISSYSGTINIAFKYTGAGTNTNQDGAYHIDNLQFFED